MGIKIATLMLAWPVIGAIAIYGSIIFQLISWIGEYDLISMDDRKKALDLAINSVLRRTASPIARLNSKDRKKETLLLNVIGWFIWPQALARMQEVMTAIKTEYDEEITAQLNRTKEES